nr:PD-(D/E)XK nuclease-like domain-containing protein [Acetobacter aceti]
MSLSSTGARKLTTDCPAIFKYERDNPTVRKRCFDIGTAGHLMVLEPEKFDDQTVLVEGFTKDGKPSAGYAATDAKEQRDAAYDAGKTPLLKPEIEMLQEMRASIWKDPVISKAFVGGETEKSMFWQDEDLRNREQESNHDTGAAS